MIALRCVPTVCADSHLAPLRGALRPAQLVQVMTNRGVAFEAFDFRGGSDRVRATDVQLLDEVSDILQRHSPGRDTYRILSLDTVQGVHGTRALLTLLAHIRESNANFQQQHWLIDLRLLRAEPRPWAATLARDFSKPKFTVNPTFYKVSNLVAEDYDASLSYTVRTDDGDQFIKPTATPGKFLYRSSDGLKVVESADIGTTIDDFLCSNITDALVTDPFSKRHATVDIA